jgi:tetratricopeptide (TPR) repeat protein
MSLFDKILGRKPAPAAQAAKQAPAPPPVPAAAPAAKAAPAPGAKPPIKRVFDGYGRSFDIPMEHWRTQFLPNKFKSQWDAAEGLANAITEALQDGLPQDCMEPVRRLREIDAKPHRAAILEGLALLQLSRFEAAREVLDASRLLHGDDASLLTYLARAHGGLGQLDERDGLLWQALELEPNHDQAMPWYVAFRTERGGKEAGQQALARIAALGGSWRAQLQQARTALDEQRTDEALGLYREALQRVEAAPGDMLHQISGDLGKHGQIAAMIELVLPRYDVKQHGLNAGNNLLKAYLDLGQTDKAGALLQQLYALNRPDWRALLNFWDVEINKAENAARAPAPAEGQPPDVVIHRFDDPVWARESLSFDLLLPPKSALAPRIFFVGGSCQLPATENEAQQTQVVGPLGVVARGLPIYLAEQAYLRTPAAASYLQQLQLGRGFVLSSRPWGAELIQAELQASYFVFMHIDASGKPWNIDFSIMEATGKTTLQQWREPFDVDKAVPDVLRIERELLARLQQAAGVEVNEISGPLRAPDDAWLPGYISSSEQTMALRSAGPRSEGSGFHLSERSVADGLLNFALQQPGNARTQLLLLSTLERIAESVPAVAAEYRDKLERLGKDLKVEGEMAQTLREAIGAILGRIAASQAAT